jgi:hypothetical protein
MGKGRLLASVCTLGLIVAAPAFAQTNTTPGSTGGHVMTRGHTMNSPHHEMMTHNRSGRRTSIRRTGRTGADASQDAQVERLNQQSLDAARRGAQPPAQGGGAPPPPAGNTKM